MAFTNKPLEWNAVGIEPDQDKKDLGFEKDEYPAAGHFDRMFNATYLAINELQQKAGEVKTVNNQLPDTNGNVNVNVDTSGFVTTQTFDEHKTDDTKHKTAAEQTFLNATDNAKFKKGNSTFTTRGTSQTFTDAFCTINSLVTVVITSSTNPQGVWSVNSANGSFTITSTVAETADIAFDYFIQKAVG